MVHHWRVSWDLTGRDPYTRWVLPFPPVTMTFTAGRCRDAGAATLTGRFVPVHELYGDPGRVVSAAVSGADDAAATGLIEDFLRGFRPVRDADAGPVAGHERRPARPPAATWTWAGWPATSATAIRPA